MRRIYAIIFILMCTTTIWAQQYGQKQNQQNQRQFFSPEMFNHALEEFVKKEADLNDNECHKFFPLMHEMMNKQRDVNGKIQRTTMKGFSAKTESDFEQIITEITNLEVESKKLEQKYYKKFNTVLSWQKIHKVRFALSRWNVEVLNMFRPQQSQNRQGWQGQQNIFGNTQWRGQNNQWREQNNQWQQRQNR